MNLCTGCHEQFSIFHMALAEELKHFDPLMEWPDNFEESFVCCHLGKQRGDRYKPALSILKRVSLCFVS